MNHDWNLKKSYEDRRQEQLGALLTCLQNLLALLNPGATTEGDAETQKAELTQGVAEMRHEIDELSAQLEPLAQRIKADELQAGFFGLRRITAKTEDCDWSGAWA